MIQECTKNFNLKNEKNKHFSKTFRSTHDVMACANLMVKIYFKNNSCFQNLPGGGRIFASFNQAHLYPIQDQSAHDTQEHFHYYGKIFVFQYLWPKVHG